VKLGDDSTYIMKGLSFVSFWIPSIDVLELDDVFFVHGLKKNILSVSCMIHLHHIVYFEH